MLLILSGISCNNSQSIEDDLLGTWIYERETFSSSSTFEDPDTRGIMTFNEDETGSWLSDNGSSLAQDIEWDFQRMETRISITKIFPGNLSGFSSSRVYSVTQDGEDSFTFRYELSFESQIDTFESFLSFENIILTRI